MKVRQLTVEQKDALIGQTYDGVQFFNPTLDADGNWFISQECIDQCIHQGITEWIHDLPQIPYNPVIVDRF